MKQRFELSPLTKGVLFIVGWFISFWALSALLGLLGLLFDFPILTSEWVDYVFYGIALVFSLIFTYWKILKHH